MPLATAKRPTLSTLDAVQLAGCCWHTAGTPRAAAVIAHGFSASTENKDVLGIASSLSTTGFDVITYDARGHGASEGKSTLGDAERLDVAAAVALARERCDRIILIGASMGAIAVLRYAAFSPTLSGVIAVSAPSRWRLPKSPTGIAAALLTRTSLGRRLAERHIGVRVASRWTNPAPPIKLVSRITAPLAIVHGTADRFISPKDAAELYDAANEPRRLTLVPDMGHAFEPASLEPILASIDWALELAERTPVRTVGMV